MMIDTERDKKITYRRGRNSVEFQVPISLPLRLRLFLDLLADCADEMTRKTVFGN